MKTYTIRHEETLVGYYEIDAESPEEAFEQYKNMCYEGLLDFTDLDFVDGKETVHETDENGCIGKAIDLSEEALNTDMNKAMDIIADVPLINPIFPDELRKVEKEND